MPKWAKDDARIGAAFGVGSMAQGSQVWKNAGNTALGALGAYKALKIFITREFGVCLLKS